MSGSALPDSAQKRFYQSAVVIETGGQWGIELDGRPLRTPLGLPLSVHSEALCLAMAEEWNEQGQKIDLATMPMNGFANGAIDRVSTSKAVFVDRIVQFAEADTVCYRSHESTDLYARQCEVWQPILHWIALELEHPFVVTRGIIHVDQPHETIAAVRDIAARMDHWELAAFSCLSATLGSVIIAYAVFRREITGNQGFEASVLDELYQAEKWGEDREATTRRNNLRSEVEDAVRFIELLRGSASI